jgi:NAD(P)-dependent dehydrogenase (short-subunit alcohol dehydrogenase family)
MTDGTPWRGAGGVPFFLNEDRTVLELQGKSAFVTGGTRGIGLAVSNLLAERGAKVVTCGSTEASVQACREHARATGRTIRALRADVNREDEVAAAIQATLEWNGGLDILVCCAGRAFRGSALNITGAEWDECLALNLRGPFLAARAAVPFLAARGNGAIVLISSIWAVTATPGRTAYIVAKSALTALARSLAVDYAPAGIRVNAVAPGYIDTDLLRRSLAEANPGRNLTELLEEVAGQHPLRRIGLPNDVAEAVLFLAGPRSTFITGQTLIVDGGLTTQIRTSSLAEQSFPDVAVAAPARNEQATKQSAS